MGYVLVVDDDPGVRDVVAGALRDDGYDVRTAADGLGAVAAVQAEPPELVVLDLRLPDVDGVHLVGRLRPDYTGPILNCSGVREERARVRALDAGADDFMLKPFGVAELRARLRALQRRSPVPSEGPVTMGDVEIDLTRRTLAVAGEERRLTPTQWRILVALAERPGQLVTHRQLAQRVWGDRSGEDARDTLRAHVRTMRKALGDSADEQRYLRTEPGVGYRWLPLPEDCDGTVAAEDDIVHELNNVLTAMRFGTHLLRQRLEDLGDTVTESGRITEVTDRLETLVSRAVRLAVDLQQKDGVPGAGGRRRGRP
jgi:two-component system KDP operon response regulator KdpE